MWSSVNTREKMRCRCKETQLKKLEPRLCTKLSPHTRKLLHKQTFRKTRALCLIYPSKASRFFPLSFSIPYYSCTTSILLAADFLRCTMINLEWRFANKMRRFLYSCDEYVFLSIFLGLYARYCEQRPRINATRDIWIIYAWRHCLEFKENNIIMSVHIYL